MKLYGTPPYLHKLHRGAHEVKPTKGKRLFVNSTNKVGKPTVTGGPDLKQSQSYPLRFGLAIAQAFADYHKTMSASQHHLEHHFALTEEDQEMLLKELPMPKNI